MIDGTVHIQGVNKPVSRIFFGTAIPVMLQGGDANLRRLAKAEEIAARHGVPVATVAMAYLLTDPMNTLAVVGMSRPERIQENLKVFDFEFALGERDELAAI